VLRVELEVEVVEVEVELVIEPRPCSSHRQPAAERDKEATKAR
jgi:hypothetical protein